MSEPGSSSVPRRKVRSPSYPFIDLKTAIERARRLFEPQVIHAHWWFPNGVVGAWLSSFAHVPLVTTLHGTDVRLVRTLALVAVPLFD